MNDLTEVNFQNEISKIKGLLSNPDAPSRAMNEEWAAVIKRHPSYNSSMFLGFLELFRLCSTPNAKGYAHGPRETIAKSIWSSIQKDYLATSKSVSSADRINDFYIAICIPGALTIASKMLEKDELQTAFLNLERGGEKPQKKDILKKLLYVSNRGPVLLEFIRIVQDQDLLKKVIEELRENRKKQNLDEYSPEIKFLESRLIQPSSQFLQSSYAKTEAKLSNNKRKNSAESFSFPPSIDDSPNNNNQKFFKTSEQDIRAVMAYVDSLEDQSEQSSLEDKKSGNGW